MDASSSLLAEILPTQPLASANDQKDKERRGSMDVFCLSMNFSFEACRVCANLYGVLRSVKSLQIYVLLKLVTTIVCPSDSGRLIRESEGGRRWMGLT